LPQAPCKNRGVAAQLPAKEPREDQGLHAAIHEKIQRSEERREGSCRGFRSHEMTPLRFRAWNKKKRIMIDSPESLEPCPVIAMSGRVFFPESSLAYSSENPDPLDFI